MISQHEMEMRGSGVATVTESREYLAGGHLLAHPHLHAARLQVRVYRPDIWTDLEDHLVASEVNWLFHMNWKLIRYFFRHIVSYEDDGAVSGGQNVGAETEILFNARAVTSEGEAFAQLHPID